MIWWLQNSKQLYLCVQWKMAVKHSQMTIYIFWMWLILFLLSFVGGKNFPSNSPSQFFCFRDNATYLPFVVAHQTQWDVFPKLFTLSLLHPDLYFHSFTAKKRRQSCWQLPLFKATLMARQFLLPLGRWLGEDEETDYDCWLWRTSQLQLIPTMPKSTHPLPSRQRHIRLCEPWNLRHGCHDAVWACERSWMMIVSSTQKRPEQKTMSPAITAS